MQRLLAWLLSLVLVLPLATLAVLSVARQWRYPALWPSTYDDRHWQLLFRLDGALPETLLRSLGIATAVALLGTAGGLFTSERIARHPERSRLLAFAVLPFAVSPVVLALSLQDAVLRLQLAGTVIGVILAQTLFAYAYATLLLNTLWTVKMHGLSELAASLGASRRQIWTQVRWPVGGGIIGVCLFQTFLMSWFDFALARLIGSGQVMTLPVQVFDYFGAGDLRLAAAAGLLLMLPPMLMLVMNRHLLAWPVSREMST